MSDRQPTSSPASTRWDILFCSALAAIAVALRAGPLGPWCLWRDDAWQALVIKADSWTTIARIGRTAPGYSALLDVWLRLTGFSATAAQALALLAGVAGVALMYLLARRCGLGMAGAAAAGLALAIAPAHVNFATRVKPFTLEADLSILLLLCAARALEQPNRRRGWLVLLLAGVLGTIFSATALPLAFSATLALAGATVAAAPRKPWLAIGGVAALSFFAVFWWAWWLAPQVNDLITEVWADYFIPLDRGFGVAAMAAKAGTSRLLEEMSPLPARFSAALIALGIVVLARRSPWLAAACVAPLIMAVVMAALRIAPYGGGRTDIYLYPSMALLVAMPVDAVTRMLPGRAGLVGFLLAAAPLAAAQKAHPYPAEDVRSIVKIVESRATQRDVVIVYPQDGYIYALYSPHPVRFLDSNLSMTGFTVALDHPRVATLILAPHSDYRATQQYSRGVVENSTAIRALSSGEHRPANVWFVARSDGKAVPAFTSILRDAGLRPASIWHFPGAGLTLWSAGS